MDSHLQTFLIVMLAAGFIVLLLLSIVVIFILIMILRRILRITQKAESVTDNLGDALKELGKKVAPIALPALVGAVIRKVSRARKSRDD